MKKIVSIIVLAASLLVSLVMFVCYDPKQEGGFQNPVDKDGDNYKWGCTDTTICPDSLLNMGDDGEAIIFDTSVFKRCDAVNPTLALRETGEKKINTEELSEFKKLMNIDQGSGWFDSLITYTKGTNGSAELILMNPCVSERAATSYSGCMEWTDKNKMPPIGKYRIWYRVEKPMCNGKVPYAEKSRELLIEEYIEPDDGTPEIELLGEPNTEVKEGGVPYSDRGVVVTLNSSRNMNLLDSVVVKGTNNNYKLTVVRPSTASINFADVKLDNNPPAGNTYTVTYYASYKSKTSNVTTYATAVRNVKVTADLAKQPAVIVLKFYRHKLKDGTPVDAPDTMLTAGSNDANYEEKGVDKVYWLNGGTEVSLPTTSVIITRQSPFVTGQTPTSSGVGRTVTYDLPGGTGYDNAVPVKRSVFLTATDCEDPATAPTIVFNGSDTIPAGTEWDYASSWSVGNRQDTDYYGTTGYKYFIYFNGLDPKKPAVKSGGYKITYVGLGKCAGAPSTERERTIIVR